MSDYGKLPGINWSSLKPMHESALMHRHRQTEPEPDSNEFRFGSAAHVATLLRDQYEARFAPYEKARNANHGEYKEWLAEHPGVVALRPQEFDYARRLADAVWAHPEAAALLRDGRAEEPLTWVEPLTGVEAKGRIDSINPGGVVELKSTTDVAIWHCRKQVETYLYHCQLAWYHNGAIARSLIPAGAAPPHIIWAEKAPPFDVAVDQLSLPDLAAGEAYYETLLRRLLACIEMNAWPGKAPTKRLLQLSQNAPGLREEAF